MNMNETATVSTVIDARAKDAITNYCKKRGIKLRYFIQQSKIDQWEYETALEGYRSRRDEKTTPLEVLGLRKSKR